jgi:hypothetical protein
MLVETTWAVLAFNSLYFCPLAVLRPYMVELISIPRAFAFFCPQFLALCLFTLVLTQYCLLTLLGLLEPWAGFSQCQRPTSLELYLDCYFALMALDLKVTQVTFPM